VKPAPKPRWPSSELSACTSDTARLPPRILDLRARGTCVARTLGPIRPPSPQRAGPPLRSDSRTPCTSSRRDYLNPLRWGGSSSSLCPWSWPSRAVARRLLKRQGTRVVVADRLRRSESRIRWEVPAAVASRKPDSDLRLRLPISDSDFRLGPPTRTSDHRSRVARLASARGESLPIFTAPAARP
jgi:hypothetical protein